MSAEINKNLKHAKVISIILGSVYSGVAGFGLLIVGLQRIMFLAFQQPPDVGFMDSLNRTHLLFVIFLPVTIVLGVCYILFGKRMNHLQGKIESINYFLSASSLLLIVSYLVIGVVFNPYMLEEQGRTPQVFKIIGISVMIIGTLVMIACFTVPQYLLVRKIKKYKKEISAV